MDDNKNLSRPEPENLPHTPNTDGVSDSADDIDDVIKIFHIDPALTQYLASSTPT